MCQCTSAAPCLLPSLALVVSHPRGLLLLLLLVVVVVIC
jgi:hypothetical protein